MSYTAKKQSTELIMEYGMGIVLKSADEDSSENYPLAYAKSIWDAVTSSKNSNLVALLGAAGQYSQEEINKAFADALATINTNIGKVESAGSYICVNSDTAFASVEALTNYSGEKNKGDYALVSGTVTENNVNIPYFDRYHYDGSGWVKDYRIIKSQFNETELEDMEHYGKIESVLMQKLSNLPTLSQLETLLGAKEDISNKTTTIDNDSTNTQYPSAAAVREFVNSSIATNTSSFRGTYETYDGLPTKANDSNLHNNDYAFVIVGGDREDPEYQRFKFVDGDGTGPTVIVVGDDYYTYAGTENKMFKWQNGNTSIYTDKGRSTNPVAVGDSVYADSNKTAQSANTVESVSNWLYEYTLNNSSFTSAQWETINSGLTKSQKNYVAQLMYNDLVAEALDKFDVSTSVQGDTVYADTKTEQVMTVTVTVTFDGQAVTPSNTSALTAAGWTAVNGSPGVYTKTQTSSIDYNDERNTTAARIIAQTFTYTPNSGTYNGIELSKSSEEKRAKIYYPTYYGFNESSTLSASVIANLRRSASGSVSTNFSTIESGGTTKYYWVVAKTVKTVSVTQLGSNFVPNTSAAEFVSRENSSINIKGYTAYRSNSLTAGGTVSKVIVSVS